MACKRPGVRVPLAPQPRIWHQARSEARWTDLTLADGWGSFSILGGIWEINYARLGWRASCHGERHRCRIPSEAGNPVLVEVSGVLSRHHCASAVAYPRTVFGDHKCRCASSHSSTGLTVR